MTERNMTEWEAAQEIGSKVIEMAERVKKFARAVPGAQAKLGFEMDDTRYEIMVRLVLK